MGKTTIGGEIVKKYLGLNPEMPLKTLAGLIYTENMSVFKNKESIRGLLRYYTGKSGHQNRKGLKDKIHVRKEIGSLNPFSALPEGKKELGDYNHIHLNGNKTLIIADTHIPYHEKIPLMLALEYGYKDGVDTVLINGDFADFYSVSRWEKDPRNRDFAKEIITVNDCLDVIRKGFPDAEIIYKIGNHEERYIRYMMLKAPELLSVKKFSFESIVEAKERGIRVIDDKRILKIGGLHIGHGHEFAGSAQSPVNPARGFFLKAKDNFLGAHFHRPSHHAENNISREFTGVWSIGCLCNLHPEYAPNNQWNWGFAIVNRDNNEFSVFNKKIIQGKVYPT